MPHYLNYPRPSTEAEESDQVRGEEGGDEEGDEDDIDVNLRKKQCCGQNDDFGAVLAFFEQIHFFSFS